MAESFNRYGRTANGKQRYICLACNRQFVENGKKEIAAARPACPICRKKMHVYMREQDFTRFRCSDYPLCRGFMKIHLRC